MVGCQEALRDLSEEQEELRAEVEHDLREEIDMTLNQVRQVYYMHFYTQYPYVIQYACRCP